MTVCSMVKVSLVFILLLLSYLQSTPENIQNQIHTCDIIFILENPAGFQNLPGLIQIADLMVENVVLFFIPVFQRNCPVKDELFFR